jgi:hypothetical protein
LAALFATYFASDSTWKAAAFRVRVVVKVRLWFRVSVRVRVRVTSSQASGRTFLMAWISSWVRVSVMISVRIGSERQRNFRSPTSPPPPLTHTKQETKASLRERVRIKGYGLGVKV